MKLSAKQDSSGPRELFQRLGLVRNDDDRRRAQPFLQNFARLAVELHICGARHAFVDQIDVEIKRKQQ